MERRRRALFMQKVLVESIKQGIGKFGIFINFTDEEISFWAWKVLSLKTAALNGFKAMYL